MLSFAVGDLDGSGKATVPLATSLDVVGVAPSEADACRRHDIGHLPDGEARPVAGALPLTLILTAVGVALTTLAVVLIVFGASGRHPDEATTAVPVAGAASPGVVGAHTAHAAHPVSLEAHLDPGLSRWQWLVKWFLAIPHVVVLVFLWIAFVVVTVVAGFSILFTGRYPRRLFDFNVGVLRWTWRVTYYATTGGIGTDEYPPFRLDQGRQRAGTAVTGRAGSTGSDGRRPADDGRGSRAGSVLILTGLSWPARGFQRRGPHRACRLTHARS